MRIAQNGLKAKHMAMAAALAAAGSTLVDHRR